MRFDPVCLTLEGGSLLLFYSSLSLGRIHCWPRCWRCWDGKSRDSDLTVKEKVVITVKNDVQRIVVKIVNT